MRNQHASFGDFRCAHCHNLVSAAHGLSAVNHRNHCPYCLWSCHLDLFAAGDRLSACKGKMRPIGLTMKQSSNKYRPARGELMLIHECMECRSLSINRIAADDDSECILTIFHDSLLDGYQLRVRCEQQGILILAAEELDTVHTGLYGKSVPILEGA